MIHGAVQSVPYYFGESPMKLTILLLALILTGCAAMKESINDYLTGPYTAPTLGGAPTPSGWQALDAIEANGYQLARQKKITWVKFVDAFYQKRAELYPKSIDTHGVNELRSYQRVLAEQMDLGKITESQWTYLIESKSAEINARNKALYNTAPRQTNCTTTNIGTQAYPEYKTTCN